MNFMSYPASVTVHLTESSLYGWLTAGVTCAPAPFTLVLEGAMGAGKTTLARMMGQALGVKGRITSPSFITLQEYETAEGVALLHLDLYRLTIESADALLLEVEDILAHRPAWVLIEWGSLFPELLPPVDVTLHITPVAPTATGRRYTLKAHSARGVTWLNALAAQEGENPPPC